MKNTIIVLVLLFIGGKYGKDYLESEKFQAYGDKSKAPWTCRVNNLMGHLAMVMSNYETAKGLFAKTAARCPDTSISETAEFEVAECLSKLSRNQEAVEAYKAYAEKYKGTRRAKIAERATQVITAS